MATTGNERYLRYIFLLEKGGPLVLKGIINREIQNEGKALSQILLDNSGRLRQLIRNDSQYERIFPAAGPVNDDLDTWDISLLCLVLLNIFGDNLNSRERNYIKNIRTFRNEVQGHFASLSLEEGEYNNYRGDLIAVLLNLSNGLNRQIYDRCQDLIKTSASGSLEIRSTLEDLKEFQEDFLAQMEINFDSTHIKLDAICNDVKRIQERGFPQNASQQLSDIETKQDETKKLSYEIKDLLVQLIKKHEVETQSSQIWSDIKEDVETRMSVRSDTAEHASNAEDTLVQRINEILKEVNRTDGISREHEVRRRVQRFLLRNQTCLHQQELTNSVLELILDIIRQTGTSVLSAKKSCIRLKCRCTTYEGMLGLLEYLESENYQKRLSDISFALTAQMGFDCSLTSKISTEHLRESLHNLAARRKNNGNSPQCKRSVVLPVRCTDVLGLEHVWNMFQEGKAGRHMERISNALSKIVGGKTVVASSVNLEQFNRALRQTDRGFSQNALQQLSDIETKQEETKKLSYEIKGTDEIKYHGAKHRKKIYDQTDNRTRLDKISTNLAIVVIGHSGVGKSSLINALRRLDNNDKNAAEVGNSKKTRCMKQYVHPKNENLVFTELSSPEEIIFLEEGYPEVVNMNSFDIFLQLCDRLTAHDILLAEELCGLGKRYYVIYTKVDIDYVSLRRRPALYIDTHIRETIERDMYILPTIPPIFLISSNEPAKYDFPKLVEQLENDAVTVAFNRKLNDAYVAFKRKQNDTYVALKDKQEFIIKVYTSKSHIQERYHHETEDLSSGLPIHLDILLRASTYKEVFHLSDSDIAQYASVCGMSESSFRTEAKLKIPRGLPWTKPFAAYVKLVVKTEKNIMWKVASYIPIIGAMVDVKLTRKVLQKILDDCRIDAMRVFDFIYHYPDSDNNTQPGFTFT